MSGVTPISRGFLAGDGICFRIGGKGGKNGVMFRDETIIGRKRCTK
jgi:hypothetical protein